jgi:glycerophosphoryl diester phosphodiesterase
MTRFAIAVTVAAMSASDATAFDLQGHRGARGLAPENTLAGFAAALSIGVTTLELDLGITGDDVVVVHHDAHLNADITRGPDGAFLSRRGPAIRSLIFDELKQYDVGRIKPGSAHAARFPEQRAVDGARIPALPEVFDFVAKAKAGHIRFNIEAKVGPTDGRETAGAERFAELVAKAVREAGLASRVSVQSFDWRSLLALKQIAPEIERVCLTSESGGFDTIQRHHLELSPWLADYDIRDVGGSLPRLVAAVECAVWSPGFRDLDQAALKEAKALKLRVIPWTVNEPTDMEKLIALGVDGIITDYPDRLRAVLSARGMALPPPVAVN